MEPQLFPCRGAALLRPLGWSGEGDGNKNEHKEHRGQSTEDTGETKNAGWKPTLQNGHEQCRGPLQRVPTKKKRQLGCCTPKKSPGRSRSAHFYNIDFTGKSASLSIKN